MRNPTPEQVQTKRLELSKLQIDWERMKRPHINLDLRNSLWTRIKELEAEIDNMETKLKVAPRRTKVLSEAATA